MIRQKWVTASADEELAKKLSEETGIEKSITRILVSRNIDTPEKIQDFLNPDINKLYDPYLLKDMDRAVARLKKALENGEKIAVYGDYDVDGITGVTVLMRFLESVGGNFFFYIPDRQTDGYGLNTAAIDAIKEKGAALILTVDCGITAVEETKYAKELGMDVVVTDHHKCPDVLPDCSAVIDPKRDDCEYPFRELAGVGVAFKLICAMNCEISEEIYEEIVSLTALGTVADIVPLTDENRIIVSTGIAMIKKGKSPGISALAAEARIPLENVNSTVLSFQVSPRINAAGRIGSADLAVKLFMSKSQDEIERIAGELNEINQQRQNVEKEIFEDALNIINSNKEYKNEEIIVVGKEGWHSGVIGIVASRITEEFFKPCIMVSFEGDVGKGSLRSIKGFNIYKALEAVSPTLEKFGGHELAAGITVKKDKFDEFKKQICDYAKENMDKSSMSREILIDSEMEFSDMTVDFVDKISKLEPFGMGNPQPIFVIKKAKVVQSRDFKDGKHLNLTVEKKNRYINAIGFSMGKFASNLKKNEEIYMIGTVAVNDFRGEKSFQFRVKDIRLG